MKVLMLNGSSHINGTTFTALNEIGKALNNEGIDYEIFQIGADAVRDCIGCNQCTPDGVHILRTMLMNSLPRQKKLMRLYLEHLYIMPTQVEEFSLS